MRVPTPKSLILKSLNRVGNFISRFSTPDHPGVNPYLMKSLREYGNRPIESNRYIREPAIQIPRYPITLWDIERMARECDIVRMCVVKLQKETFRQGYEWVPADPESGDDALKLEYERADEFFKGVNDNGQTLIDVLRRIEDDLNVFDDAYFITIFDYVLDDDGLIIDKFPTEFIRGSPIYLRRVTDSRGNLGGKHRICLHHRDVGHESNELTCTQPGCGCKTHDVHYISVYAGGKESVDRYYIEDEVIQMHKYEANLVYGYSPIASFWRKAYTLIYMDKYAQDYYELQRPPRAMLTFPTRNQAELKKLQDEIEIEKQSNPHYVPWVNTDPDAKSEPKFIDFMDSLKEGDNISIRTEFRERIAGFYGVSPVMQGDVSQGGGLNNEGMQFVVTNRAVEDSQYTYNTTLFPRLVGFFNIRNWDLKLKESEEEDEAAEIQRMNMHLVNAGLAVSLGLDVKFKKGEPIIEDGIVSKPVEESEAPDISDFGTEQISGKPDIFSLGKDLTKSSKIDTVLADYSDEDYPIILKIKK